MPKTPYFSNIFAFIIVFGHYNNIIFKGLPDRKSKVNIRLGKVTANQ